MNLTEFLNSSYTAYHATQNACSILNDNGFVELSLDAKWKLSPNGKYYVVCNGSSVVAFRVGANKVFNLCQSHTDSPSFKVKGNALVASDSVKRLNTEQYGGGLLYSFFDRPLKIAGRIVEETANGVEQRLVVSEYNVVIPSLAIHHNPKANEAFSVNAQVDTLPLFAKDNAELYSTLALSGKVLDADLYVVPSTDAFYAGVNGEFLCSARLDNLTSVYSSICALVSAKPQNIAVVACLDNEEVGSRTYYGNPSFVARVLENISQSLNIDMRAALENGVALSVDNAHATHPAHGEKADPVNRVNLNGGVVIKHHPNYATDGLTAAIFKKICNNCGVKYQDYYNNSGVRCGSTLGLVTASTLGIKTCDIGIAQLAMHSACETCGASDVGEMEKCLTAFLSAKISGNQGKVEL